jgi:hypothetical protein
MDERPLPSSTSTVVPHADFGLLEFVIVALMTMLLALMGRL